MARRSKSLIETFNSHLRPAGIAAVCAMAILAAQPALAQRPIKEPLVDESFSIRQNEQLFQLEEVATLLSTSLNKLQGKVSNLAINSVHFGKGIDADFRRKAEIIILEKMFQANPSIKLVQCQECNKLVTKIVRGVLKLRKGIPSVEARMALAKKLSVDGFIDIGIFRDDNQISIYVKVTEAQSGAIVLVDEQVGRRAPKRDALTFSFGEMTFPITSSSGTSAEHNAIVLGVNETVQLTGRFSFGVDLNLFLDNNTNNSEAFISLDGGLVLAPYVGFDIVQMSASTSRLIFLLGIGKLLSPQLEYANFVKGGLQFVVGDKLVITFAVNSFLEKDIENSNKITGTGSELLFGYRF